MSSPAIARTVHATTAVVVGLALVAQLVLVVQGARVLTETPDPLSVRLFHLASYFTVQSNVLVLVAAVTLARRPDRDGRWWRVARLASLTGITVTGGVHWFLLRPLLHLTGWSYATDLLLHVVSPLLAVLGWLAVGPRPRVDRAAVLLSLVWPVVWLVATMLTGALSGWYPYPFLDVGHAGLTAVTAAVLAVTGVFVAVSLLFAWGDRRLSR